MKAKILVAIPISDNDTLAKNSEVEIVDGHCGTDGYYYTCKVFNDRQIIIKSDLLEITDHTPYINWEQRRYELAKAAMQGILSNDNSQAIAMNPNDDNCKEYPTGIAQYAVACADALIAELRKGYL